ncbi:MAG TPA: chorismate synthase [Oligoflexia bacterium]|nr:chorismate synthase [Oligoflexia bacterium]HMP48149.1 chorismate synthase [Oligoflexia bacterium]
MLNNNTFGNNFRVSTFGESHGPALGVIVDGCPSDFTLDLELIRHELNRRKPGQSRLVSPRNETDDFEILSGLFEGKTTGTPIAAIFRNNDVRSKDYSEIKDLFRPGHADFTYHKKYNHRDYRGGGRSSARETISRVFAGGIAKQLLAPIGIIIEGGLSQVGRIKAEKFLYDFAEDNIVRGLDPDKVEEMINEIETARKDRDSVGGVLSLRARGVPAGIGEPVFSKLSAAIGGAMFSIPAVKGVEIGGGFSLSEERGSSANDEMRSTGFQSNNHGGILGGISSGAPIEIKIAIKPTSSLPKTQRTVTTEGIESEIVTKGRHDPCVAIRAVPIAEAMLALVLIDLLLIHYGKEHIKEKITNKA